MTWSEFPNHPTGTPTPGRPVAAEAAIDVFKSSKSMLRTTQNAKQAR
jgi:hypothetical protein